MNHLNTKSRELGEYWNHEPVLRAIENPYVPLAHRVYLALRVLQGLRQKEILAFTQTQIHPGVPMPLIKFGDGSNFKREIPLHPSIVVLIERFARASYLPPNEPMLSLLELRAIEQDWSRLFGSLALRSEQVLGDWFGFFRRYPSATKWREACQFLMGFRLDVLQDLPIGAEILAPGDAIGKFEAQFLGAIDLGAERARRNKNVN